jgi:tight adherence protein C
MTAFFSSPLAFWFVALAIGGATGLLVWSGTRSSAALLDPIRRRLAALQEPDDVAVRVENEKGGVLARLFALLEPKGDPGAQSRVQLRLNQAGYRTRGALGAFYAAKILTVVVLVGAIFVVQWARPELHLSKALAALLVPVAFAIAWLGTEMWLDRAVENRRSSLMEGLPDALDLLVACTEAGLSLNAALERVVEQMPASYPALARELGMVNAEMRAGVERTAALKNLAERTGLEEIRGLVSLITHSARLGTGIAGTLRIYAHEFRDRRMQRAEELAATISTKLIFPLVLCLFPSFFLVAVGPAVLGVIRALAGAGL